MKFKKRFFIVLSFVLILGLSSVAISTAYTGTGFNHNISFSKYSDKSVDEILDNYNDTNCTKEFSGKCTYVVDGDTIDVDGIGRIRLVGVNTPERGANGYITSKRFVQKLCLNKEISLDIDDSKGTDRYGRSLAVIIVDGKNLNEVLLKEGLAEVMYIPPSEFYPYDWGNSSTSILNYICSSSSTNTYSSSSDSFSSSSNDLGLFVASSNSNKFHKPYCRWAKKIHDSNKISFNSRSEAINQGYEPCKVCQP